MYPVTDAFKDALTKSHEIVSAALIGDRATWIAVPTSVMLDGSVTVDYNAAVRRRATVQLVDPGGLWTPATAADALAPYGNELFLYRGIRYPNGTTELAPLGIFGISDVNIADGPDGLTISVDASDRSASISAARFDDLYVQAAGVEVSVAVRALIESRRPGLAYNLATTAFTVPAIALTETDDPWTAAQAWYRAAGCDLYFDPTGVVTATPTPDPATTPTVWNYAEGATATLLNVGRKISDARGYNGVVATGETTGNTYPVRATVWDIDPSSPTYYLGKYGRRPRFYSSPFLTTAAQAATAATSLLRRLAGTTEQVEFSAIVNPAHEAGDAIQISRARSKVDALHILDTFTIPLTAAGSMPATTRLRGDVPDA